MTVLCYVYRQSQFPKYAVGHIRRQINIISGRYLGTTSRRIFSSLHSVNDGQNHRILSLKPELFIQKQQEVLDLSGLINPTLSIHTRAKSHSLSIPFNTTRPKAEALREVYIPFPKHARGVFYWHSNADLHPMMNTIRFRLCDSIGDFQKGTDLRTAAGLLWGPPLWRIAWHRNWDGLRDLIRDEKLVPSSFVEEDNTVLSALNAEDDPNPLFSLNQPIVLDLSRWVHSVHLVTRNSMDAFRMSHLFRDKTIQTQPYSGHISIRFELSPRHSKPHLCIRILDHVTPVTARFPNYLARKKARILPLIPGSLFTKRGKRGKTAPPWGYSLESSRYGGIWDNFLKHSAP